MTSDVRSPWTKLTALPRLDPDLALVRQFRATGSPAVFEILFRKYQTTVFSFVSRMVNGEDAYDLTQEVFVRALRSLPSFSGGCKFRTWLLTIAPQCVPEPSAGPAASPRTGSRVARRRPGYAWLCWRAVRPCCRHHTHC